MKQVLYAMRRANGDWFALESGGQNRVPVFRTLDGAWRARARNPELMLFRPARIDEKALEELATADGGRPAGFWLVDEEDPATILTRGRPLGFEQLATLEGLPAAVRFERRPVRAAGLGSPARAA
ncbi:MAG: hypothetical protein M3416_14315 [Acidobacteriota bacterium]|nr:hypothetical protein [Acidobacteriota bacterium]